MWVGSLVPGSMSGHADGPIGAWWHIWAYNLPPQRFFKTDKYNFAKIALASQFSFAQFCSALLNFAQL